MTLTQHPVDGPPVARTVLMRGLWISGPRLDGEEVVVVGRVNFRNVLLADRIIITRTEARVVAAGRNLFKLSWLIAVVAIVAVPVVLANSALAALISQDTTPSAATCMHARDGSWRTSGSGLDVEIATLRWADHTLRIPINVNNKSGGDVDLAVKVYDKNNLEIQVPDGQWKGSPPAGLGARRSELAIPIDGVAPPAALTLVFQDWRWEASQRLRCQVPIPPALRVQIQRDSILQASPSPQSTSPSPFDVTTKGPWPKSGHGVTVRVESVTRQGNELTVPISVTSQDDLHAFDVSVSDQDGNPLNQEPFRSQWVRQPQAGLPARSTLVLTFPVDRPPSSLTLTFKDFFWEQGQRLVIKVPMPA